VSGDVPIVLVTLAVIGLLGLTGVLVHRTRPASAPALTRLAATSRTSLRRLIAVFERRLPWGVAAALATLVPLVVALALTWAIGSVLTDAGDGAAAWIDYDVALFFADQRGPRLTSVYTAITYLGDTLFLLPVAVVVGLLWRRRRGDWLALTTLVGTYLGAAAIYNVGKVLAARARPGQTLRIHDEAGLAFPSGHATQAFSFYLMLALLLLTVLTTYAYRVAVVVLALSVATLVAISRLYLGAHWLTDVIAGAVLGASWAMLLWLVIEAAEQRRGRPLVGDIAPSASEDRARTG
jgi:membrane-associated phospholipid phosphatase